MGTGTAAAVRTNVIPLCDLRVSSVVSGKRKQTRAYQVISTTKTEEMVGQGTCFAKLNPGGLGVFFVLFFVLPYLQWDLNV